MRFLKTRDRPNTRFAKARVWLDTRFLLYPRFLPLFCPSPGHWVMQQKWRKVLTPGRTVAVRQPSSDGRLSRRGSAAPALAWPRNSPGVAGPSVVVRLLAAISSSSSLVCSGLVAPVVADSGVAAMGSSVFLFHPLGSGLVVLHRRPWGRICSSLW